MNAPVLVRAGLFTRALPREQTLLVGLLKTVLVGVAVLAIGAMLVAAAFRLSYPFPLQITEAFSREALARILRGEALYVAPTLQHVPMTYGPISFYLSAAVAAVAGLSYTPLRLVSLLGSIGSLLLIAYLIKHETGNRIASLVGAGLLAATYPLSGTVMDLGRVDALFTFFLLAALVLARTRPGWWGLAASGVLVGLAGLTKLPVGVAPVGLAILLYLVFFARSRAVAFIVGAVAAVAVGLLVLRWQTGPWATFYMLTLPGQHAFDDHGDLAGRFWFLDILPRFTFALLFGPLFLLSRAVAGDRRPLVFYTLAVASVLGLGWVSRSNSGGATNVELPAHAGIALLFGLGVDWALQLGKAASAQARTLQAYLLGVCVLQFALLIYNPRLTVPYRSEQWAAERLSTTLADMPGEVFAPDLDAYLIASDKGEQPHLGALQELFGGYGGNLTEPGDVWRSQFDSALRERRYSHVVLTSDACCDIGGVLSRNGYVAVGPLFPPGDDYWLWTGSRTPNDLQVWSPQPRSSASR